VRQAGFEDMATHNLIAEPETVHWGFFDASLPPVLSLRSGNILEVLTEPAAPTQILPDLTSRGSEAFRRIVTGKTMGASSHIMNGPVFVEGAHPGEALEVFFERIDLRYDWAYNAILPKKGGLCEEFHSTRCVIAHLDKIAMTGRWKAGLRVPLAPFFGSVGVAPRAALGKVPSALPGPWGGNIDNKELVAGTRLFLPIFNEGALFSIGDGHACQGDGEVDSFALETGLDASLRLTIRRDMTLNVPRIETPTHHILMGFDAILDNAVKAALHEGLSFLTSEKGLSKEDAYTLCSIAGDLRITQITNGMKGVHLMLAKSLFA